MKKFIYMFLTAILVIVSLFSAVGCKDGQESSENQKYDVTIKVKNTLGEEWIFTPEIEEMEYEMEYTGEDVDFYVESYQLRDHPDWGDLWLTPSRIDYPNTLKVYPFLYTDPEGNQSETNYVNERGKYVFSCDANSSSTLWNYRYINLYITVV